MKSNFLHLTKDWQLSNIFGLKFFTTKFFSQPKCLYLPKYSPNFFPFTYKYYKRTKHIYPSSSWNKVWSSYVEILKKTAVTYINC